LIIGAADFTLPERPFRMSAESELLTRIAQQRDRAAFAALFDSYAPRVKSFMMRKGASSEQAEDLVQETMIAVWSKAQMYVADRGSVTTWIFTIARNLRIDRLRREKTSLYSDIDDYDAESLDVQQDDAGRWLCCQGTCANPDRTTRVTHS
jgi:RNA polymerase sigma-70 factor, ECF subfamily